MPKLILVIGGNATGKTHFIRQHFSGKGMTLFNVYDYQQRVFNEAGERCRQRVDEKGETMRLVFLGDQARYLMKANNLLLDDIKEALSRGEDVVVEHTLYMAKRRIAYIDALREAVKDLVIELYIMRPSDAQWEANATSRGDADHFSRYKEEAKIIEPPNVSEGLDAIYEVVDGEIKLRMDPPRPEILETARRELAEEDERLRKQDEAREKRRRLIESMNERPFWHYCEVCGRREYITAQDAYDAGWDYPPHIGRFGLLGPRICGQCPMANTLYWKIMSSRAIPIVCEGDLTPKELVTWRRIKGEPESLLEEEMEEEPKEG